MIEDRIRFSLYKFLYKEIKHLVLMFLMSCHGILNKCWFYHFSSFYIYSNSERFSMF